MHRQSALFRRCSTRWNAKDSETHRATNTAIRHSLVGLKAELVATWISNATIKEILDHPFFVGTLFVPQTQFREMMPHPLVSGFLSAVLRHRTTERAPSPG
jgi:CTP synthase (UTP-ammonia lyase)